jgi:hypothetical protein
VKLVLSFVARGQPELLDAQLAFHLNAGIDLVLAGDPGVEAGVTELLTAYEPTGRVRRVPAGPAVDDADLRTRMARLAAGELEADWLFDTEPGDFWLPRGESLQDVLVAIPPRYGVVQALVRVFLPRPVDGRPFFERMTARGATASTRDETKGNLEWALRPVYRAREDLVFGLDRETALDGRVPMRAWYPIELLRFPVRTPEQADRDLVLASARSRIEQASLEASRAGGLREGWQELVLTDDELARGIADETLVEDARLRDALHRLASARESTSPGAFSLESGLGLPAPTVVDDVAYAVECAAVREVDFEPLVARIGELEHRIAALEAGFWRRARRVVARLLRR